MNSLILSKMNMKKNCDPRALTAFKKNKERDICIAAMILGTGIRVSEASQR